MRQTGAVPPALAGLETRRQPQRDRAQGSPQGSPGRIQGWGVWTARVRIKTRFEIARSKALCHRRPPVIQPRHRLGASAVLGDQLEELRPIDPQRIGPDPGRQRPQQGRDEPIPVIDLLIEQAAIAAERGLEIGSRGRRRIHGGLNNLQWRVDTPHLTGIGMDRPSSRSGTISSPHVSTLSLHRPAASPNA